MICPDCGYYVRCPRCEGVCPNCGAELGKEKPLKDLYGANVEWGGGAKCVLCGSPMPDNEIRCRRCHP